MSQFEYTARAEVQKVKGTHRIARLESGATFEMGVHGAVKSHFGLDAEPDRPLPVDYVVAATGG